MNRIVTWLREEAASAGFQDAIAEGEAGTVEARLRLEVSRARVDMLREAIRCLRVLPPPGAGEVTPLAVFLSHPADDLVVEVLEAFAAWRSTDILPAILAQYETLARTDRPEVADALVRCLRALTGRSFASADELAACLRQAHCAA